MIINEINLQGIFIFKSGIQYEINDMIVYNNILYVVIDSYTGNVTPNIAPQCKPYTEVHGVNTSTDNDATKVVTASGLKEVINSMFKGLSLEGEISTLNGSQINLNTFIDTGAYFLILSNGLNLGQFVLTPTGTKALFRVYKSGDLVIQEIIDYTQPVMYYRYLLNDQWNNWKLLSNGTQATIDTVNDSLDQFLTQAASFTNKVSVIEDYKRIIFHDIVAFADLSLTNQIDISANPFNTIFVEVVSRSMLHVGISSRLNNPIPTQEWIFIDLSLTDVGIITGNDGSRVYYKVNYSVNNLSNVELRIIYPNSNAGIFKVLTAKTY